MKIEDEIIEAQERGDLERIKALTVNADAFLDEASRKMSGDFWTPKRWVDKAHQYVENTLGPHWREDYVVWEPSCGGKNMTRDYDFNELYLSTLMQEQLDLSSAYNTSSVAFQYDFLNDDVELMHGEGSKVDSGSLFEDKVKSFQEMTIEEKVSALKMPEGLVRALYEKKPFVFFGNPPYGSAGSGTGKDSKAGIGKTNFGDLMRFQKIGKAASELYTQFMYRAVLISRVFEYDVLNGDQFHIIFFGKHIYTSKEYAPFLIDIMNDFTYIGHFMMNAKEFPGLKEWPIVFQHFALGGWHQNEFPMDVLVSNDEGVIGSMLLNGYPYRYTAHNQFIPGDSSFTSLWRPDFNLR